MKVLLVYPPTIESMSFVDMMYIQEPLALEYVASHLQDEHQLKILDMRLEKDLFGVIAAFNPDIVGFTAYTIQVNTVLRLAQEIKHQHSEIKIAVGGHHATVSPQDFFAPAIDVVVIGEGVFTFREYLAALADGADLAKIAGIAFRTGSEFVQNSERPYPGLDALHPPARHLTAGYRDKYFMEEYAPMAAIRTSKGCPFRCRFCALWKEARGKYLKRDIAGIIAELKTIEEPYLFFADDESFIDTKYMNALADAISNAGITKKYYTYIRSDTFIDHSEMVKKWASIGLTKVHMGIESHRPEDLKLWNKKNTVDNNARAIQIAEELGIDVTATFIIKQDYLEKDFDDLLEFISKVKITSCFFSLLTLCLELSCIKNTKTTCLLEITTGSIWCIP